MQKNRKKFLEQLNKKRREFEEALQRLIENQRAYNGHLYGDQFTDESDHAQREISAASNYSLIERKTRELKQIDRLIQKVTQDENFGICEECGEPIPAKRLLAVPETTLCVNCQRELEKMDQLRSLSARNHTGYPTGLSSEWEQDSDSEPGDFEIVETEDLEFLPFVESEFSDAGEEVKSK
ncbi:MAG: hypothetical protein DRH12_02915 [Deltaproteobacteria bacterium]|nr:MAG: hypothetical protein DRH12_02915 [Deltaproteobacteria bacterium]RLB85527.1 MAG: hypothetical protein DRH15_03285 [Deltaproteobacteria bacterium]